MGLLFKLLDPAVFIHLQHTETGHVFFRRKLFTYNGDICFLLNMIFQNFIIVQLVHAVTRSDDHIRLMTSLQEIQVLVDRISGTLIPEAVFLVIVGVNTNIPPAYGRSSTI